VFAGRRRSRSRLRLRKWNQEFQINFKDQITKEVAK
jgi:hypothetical protein